MRFVTYKTKKEFFVGCLWDKHILVLSKIFRHTNQEEPPIWLSNLVALLTQPGWFEKTKKLVGIVKDTTSTPGGIEEFASMGLLINSKTAKITAPILNPDKIICIGLNYKDHCQEQKIPFPKTPILFSKFSTAIIGRDANIVKPSVTKQLDFEGELAFIIGKEGKHIKQAEAMDYVAGYTIFNDISARDIQFSDKQWLRGKTFDTFAPMGPYLVTKDEIGDPHNLNIKVNVNGKIMQDSNTSNMIHKIPSLVSFISQVVTLHPGDVIATGTPSGVGVFRKPPVFLKAGDKISIEIDGLGQLTNSVVNA